MKECIICRESVPDNQELPEKCRHCEIKEECPLVAHLCIKCRNDVENNRERVKKKLNTLPDKARDKLGMIFMEFTLITHLKEMTSKISEFIEDMDEKMDLNEKKDMPPFSGNEDMPSFPFIENEKEFFNFLKSRRHGPPPFMNKGRSQQRPPFMNN